MTDLAHDLGGQHGLSAKAVAGMIRIVKMAVCAADFCTPPGCDQITKGRIQTKDAAMDLLDALYVLPVSDQGDSNNINSTSAKHKRAMHAMITPLQCLNFGFSFSNSVGQVLRELVSVTYAVEYTLEMFHKGYWGCVDRLGDLMLETLIGGGVTVMELCLEQEATAAVIGGIKLLLDTNYIQLLSCLICRQLSLLQGFVSPSPSHMMTTCFHFLFICTRMLDICHIGNFPDDGHRLAGPMTVEASKRIFCRAEPDPYSLRSVTTPHTILTYAAGFDSELTYHGSEHTTPPMSPSHQNLFYGLNPMTPRVLLKMLAWHTKQGPYLGGILLAYQEANHWPHNGSSKNQAAPEDRVCCIFSSFLILVYSSQRLLQGILGPQQPSRKKNAKNARGTPLLQRVPTITDYSNYGFEYMALMQTSLKHSDETLMAEGSAVPRRQLMQLYKAVIERLPVVALEVFVRLCYKRQTTFSAQLHVQQVLELCLYLLCRQEAITVDTLAPLLSLTNTVLKLVVCDLIGAGTEPAYAPLDPDIPVMCINSLKAIQSCAIPHCPMLVNLSAAVATILTIVVDISDTGFKAVASEVKEMGNLGGWQSVVLSVLSCNKRREGDSRLRLHGQAWSNFAAESRVCPTVQRCGNFDCNNKEGCSEAALPTLLCSGCRVVRYCSVACQKFSWKFNGHAQKCGINGVCI